MRIARLAGLAVLLTFLGACTSYVKTYDAQHTLLGSCVARRGLLFGGGTSCTGSADPKDQR
ncbi:MAG: hypothetical protein KGL53_07915 [Elusimicrobia bacterium]|nr:hypothetical protein [Elusimicrobiota bacterium]